jgi:two-component system, chemotaxis family, response regulator Rcp1
MAELSLTQQVCMIPLEVLLVEDNAGDALLASQILAEAPIPVKLHIARDGAQALQMLAGERLKPDIVILDLGLPEIDGLRVMERYHPVDVPIVVFSASRRESDKLLAKALGASEYVVKPTDLQDFRDAVWGMIQRWGGWRGGDSASA